MHLYLGQNVQLSFLCHKTYMDYEFTKEVIDIKDRKHLIKHSRKSDHSCNNCKCYKVTHKLVYRGTEITLKFITSILLFPLRESKQVWMPTFWAKPLEVAF